MREDIELQRICRALIKKKGIVEAFFIIEKLLSNTKISYSKRSALMNVWNKTTKPF